MVTRGRRDLLAVLQVTDAAEVAARLRVSETTVSYWASGQRKPGKDHQQLLERIYRIPAWGWSVPAPRVLTL